jgi:hypothetical protein
VHHIPDLDEIMDRHDALDHSLSLIVAALKAAVPGGLVPVEVRRLMLSSRVGYVMLCRWPSRVDAEM